MSRLAQNLLILLFASMVWANAGGAGTRDTARRAEAGLTGGMSAWQAQPRSERVSLSEAISRAQRRFPGRVLKAETKRAGGRPQHVVRIINDQGRVRTFHIDAQTGEFL